MDLLEPTAEDLILIDTVGLSDQLEGMREQVNLDAFRLEMQDKAGIDLEEAITAADLSRTMEGASALTVSVEDSIERRILLSGRLGRRVDVEIDGLWFTLAGVTKQQRSLKLKFEDRALNRLRYHDKFIKVNRDSMTRAQFVLRLLRELRDSDKLDVPFIIPELTVKQAVSDIQPGQIIVSADGTPLVTKADPTLSDQGRATGISVVVKLSIANGPASPEQIQNANIILDRAKAMNLPRAVMVIAMMVAIQESSIKNLGQPSPGAGNYLGPDPNGNPVGVYQQIKKYGWPATRDVATDATGFLQALGPVYAAHPGWEYWQIGGRSQNQGLPDDPSTWETLFPAKVQEIKPYAQWQTEAEQIVNAYGIVGGDIAANPSTANNQTPQTYQTGGYEFTRGIISQLSQGQVVLTKETSWSCMQRLAQEVGWRAFFVGKTFYFLSEKWLFQSKPFMVISEDTDGVDWIDGDYDEGKKYAELQVTAHLGRWSAPPGSVVQIVDMGVFDGRWLVNDVDRSLYKTVATITLKKPRPILPEATQNTAAGVDPTSINFGIGRGTSNPPPQAQAVSPVGYHDPFRNVPGLYSARIDMGVDYASSSSDPIYAIGNGRINYFSRSAWWPGGMFIGYTLLDGPAQGLSVYVSEYIVPIKDWQIGEVVHADTILARFVPGLTFHGNGIETGWSYAGSLDAMAHGMANSPHHATVFGANFSEFLASLNIRNAGRYDPPDVRGQEAGTLPDKWPHWVVVPGF